MDKFLATKKRRADQMLWSKPDEHLAKVANCGVVLAVSGGPDSRALLEAVASWPKRLSIKFVVAAVDHGVRKESLMEAQFIARRAQRLGFIAHHESIVNFGLCGENDLRIARFRALKGIAKEHDCRTICLAHHSDDDAEGYFMALMGVGGGQLGAAMNEIEKMDDIFLCRPFLSLTKKDLVLSLSLKGLNDFARDSIDEARVGERAYVRYEILPELFRLAPGVKKRLQVFGKNQREKQSVIDELARSLIVWGENTAKISLSPSSDKALIVSAIWEILKKWSNGKDLRACQPTIERIVKDLSVTAILSNSAVAGLDPMPNGFNLRHLSVKLYQFPGVLVERHPKNLVLMRI